MGTMTSGTADDNRTCTYSFPFSIRIEALIVLRTTVLTLFVAAAAGGAIAQTCNPAIDGTYCQQQMPRAPRPSTAPGVRTMPGIRSGEAFSISADDRPATLGAITFNSDGSRCIGLVRRFNCK